MTDIGCFGLPSTHNNESPACKACPHAAACRKSAVQIAQAVKGKVDVTAFMSTLTDCFMAPNALPIAQRVYAAPAKVQPRLERMLKAKQDVLMQTRLALGENPFREAGDVCLREMGRMLVLSGFTRAYMVEHLCVLGWGLSAARSHVSNCVALLKGLDLIEIEGRLITVNSQIQKVPIQE